MFTAETFNDVPGVTDPVATGGDITGPNDPRYKFQPPFNKVSRERDPGEVNLNTVTGHRTNFDEPPWASYSGSGTPQIWSKVFDGIMHRDHDLNQVDRASHFGPAWRDVVLSRRGYAQVDATRQSVDKPADVPDAFDFGVDASWLRRHHFDRFAGGRSNTWGRSSVDDDDPANTRYRTINDTREAGFGNGDELVVGTSGELLPLPPELQSTANAIRISTTSR
jgi:hypothetical protein